MELAKQQIDNGPLEAMAARQNAPRGRSTEQPTARILHLLSVIDKHQGQLVCGKLYRFDPKEGVVVRMASDAEASVTKLFARNLIERRMDGRLIPTGPGRRALELFNSTKKTQP